MSSLEIHLDGDGIWSDMGDGRTIYQVEHMQVTTLAGGMESGKPSVALRIDLPNGASVLAEISMELFMTAAGVFAAKYGIDVLPTV